MKEKSFDCVRMKYEIQQKLLREMSGLSPEDRRTFTMKMILSDPILDALWRRARRTSSRTK